MATAMANPTDLADPTMAQRDLLKAAENAVYALNLAGDYLQDSRLVRLAQSTYRSADALERALARAREVAL